MLRIGAENPVLVAYVVILAIAAIGAIFIWRSHRTVIERHEFAKEFIGRPQESLRSGGKNSEAYGWMTHRSQRTDGA